MHKPHENSALTPEVQSFVDNVIVPNLVQEFLRENVETERLAHESDFVEDTPIKTAGMGVGQ